VTDHAPVGALKRLSDPSELRRRIRAGRWTHHTSGQAPGYAQANLVVVPLSVAFDFLLFAQRNPKPCPVLEVLDPGDPVPHLTAPDADIRTDLPGYRVYRGGKLVEERTDIADLWGPDAVAFLIGCSFTFDEALARAGVPVRHEAIGRNVPMYRTTLQTRPAGTFKGRMVVSMRPIPSDLVGRAVEVTARLPGVHGSPVHVGSPEALGIRDLDDPDYGDPVPIDRDEVAVFWACGVTPQAIALEAAPEWLIGHSPGKMFVSDVENERLEVFGGGFLR
jgi:uncharacterized protein YcsI (UPF0317 family)